jgi:hypothetical protein
MSDEARAHQLRCKTLTPLQAGEAERLVARFIAARGVTVCPPRFVAPVESADLGTR